MVQYKTADQLQFGLIALVQTVIGLTFHCAFVGFYHEISIETTAELKLELNCY